MISSSSILSCMIEGERDIKERRKKRKREMEDEASNKSTRSTSSLPFSSLLFIHFIHQEDLQVKEREKKERTDRTCLFPFICCFFQLLQLSNNDFHKRSIESSFHPCKLLLDSTAFLFHQSFRSDG